MARKVQAVKEKKVGLIAQAQAEYDAIMDEIREYWQKAKELREQAQQLRQSRDSQAAVEAKRLLEQAEYYDQLGDEKDGHPRLEALRRIDDLQRQASALKANISYNESVLAKQQRELEGAKEEAILIVKRAEERVQVTEQLLVCAVEQLAELEGNRVE
ncbi:hypothetical protein [Effusibacillus dendaii]|uniref:Uncharacterized protein n=1 Tax=Effusibacillus dendaii TaxID=2743772 RepID=A0A7I8DC53_9BACL|nr:hypothetical protein [Effusibacillus dendaii]BCJ87675.1 hypothetical protein skT53_26600 [Effusibacillus dendaii]